MITGLHPVGSASWRIYGGTTIFLRGMVLVYEWPFDNESPRGGFSMGMLLRDRRGWLGVLSVFLATASGLVGLYFHSFSWVLVMSAVRARQ